MGLCCCKETPKIKEGVLYDDVKHLLKPFTPILFKGSDFVSKTICDIERFGNRIARSGDFSHVGMIVTSDILDHPKVLPNKIYVWESTMSGRLGSGVKNIYDKSYLGVQLRDFDELVVGYDKPNVTRIAYGELIHNPIDDMPMAELKEKFTQLFTELDGTRYDLNMYSLLSAICPGLRCARQKIEEVCHTEKWLFCSELVATVYITMGIYPHTVNPKDVVPRDIAFPEADTDQTPVILSNEPTYIVSELHCNPKIKDYIAVNL